MNESDRGGNQQTHDAASPVAVPGEHRQCQDDGHT